MAKRAASVSVGELLHEVVDLIVDVSERPFDDQGRTVGKAVVRVQHVEQLIRSEENVRELVEDSLGHRKMNGSQGVDRGCGFQGHST